MTEANIWQPRSILVIDGDLWYATERFIATEGQTEFLITAFEYSAGSAALRVFKNGKFLDIGYDFNEDPSGTKFTLTAGATVGDVVSVLGSLGVGLDAAEAWAINPEDIPVSIADGGNGFNTFSALHWATKAAAIETAALATLTVFEYTATAAQTTFTGADDAAQVLEYTPGAVTISLNGSILKSADFVATDGTSITIAAATVGDILQISSFAAFAITNAYTKQEIDGGVAITPDIDGGTIDAAVITNVAINGGTMDGADITASTMDDSTLEDNTLNGLLTMLGSISANGELILPSQMGFLSDVSSDIQAQLDSKQPASASILAESFVSSDQTITSAGALVLPHGLSSPPLLIQLMLKCTTAELGYSIDDEVFVGFMSRATGEGISIVPDNTNLNIRYGNDLKVFRLIRKDTGLDEAITITSWVLIVKAWA